MAENALAPEQKLPKAPPELPDDEVLYELADLFRVFGDSTRIKILYALHDDELCVQDIANAVQLSQSAVSHQLRVLKDSKLVRFRRDGKTISSGTLHGHGPHRRVMPPKRCKLCRTLRRSGDIERKAGTYYEKELQDRS